jgi:hypothetical protein
MSLKSYEQIVKSNLQRMSCLEKKSQQSTSGIIDWQCEITDLVQRAITEAENLSSWISTVVRVGWKWLEATRQGSK